MPKDLKAILRELDDKRRILRMPVRILAERSGVSPSTVHRVLSGSTSASVAAVARVARELGADLVLTNRKDPGKMLREEAERKATRIVEMVQATSALEAQGVTRHQLDVMRERAAADLMSGSGRKVWQK